MELNRQRKTLSPAFSIPAIRNLTPIFFDSAYKVKLLTVPLYRKARLKLNEAQIGLGHTPGRVR